MRQVILSRRPDVDPVPGDFSVVEAKMPETPDGKLLVKVLWLSVDPYVRLNLDDPTIAGIPGQPLGEMPLGRAVSQVVESRHRDFKPGDIIEGRTHWGEYVIVDPAVKPVKLDFGDLPLSYAVGALGMPGQTAYSGIVQVLKVQEGETVLISAAAGAVGTQAGQIAKLLGARVVGIAGGAAKCRAVVDAGFDACIDYKSPDFGAELAAALPNGFNAYFENVGGDLTLNIIPHAVFQARMALCGLVSIYGVGKEEGPDRMPELLRGLFVKGLSITPFFGEVMGGAEAIAANRAWIEEGKLKPVETRLEGIESMPEAFSGIFRGNDNIGKVVLHVSDPD